MLNGTSTISICERKIGPESPSFIIAEVAQAHDGSLGTAHAYIDAVAAAGADAVKFQTHIADAESTPLERFRVSGFPQDATRYEYWKRMEFSPDQWAELAKHAKERGLIFLSTPFSLEAVKLLDDLGVPGWKIGSGEITFNRLLRAVAETQRPIMLSSGMASWAEIDAAVTIFREKGAPFGVFQCTTAYPCPAESIGLNVLHEIRERYGCPVGLSDHSGTIFPSIAAAVLGADFLEVHVVFSRDCFGPDVNASVLTSELPELVRGVRFVETCLRNPVVKDRFSRSSEDLRGLFGRSLVAASDLRKGTRLTSAHFALKKPGGGIPEERLDDFLGRRLIRDREKNDLFEEQDFE